MELTDKELTISVVEDLFRSINCSPFFERDSDGIVTWSLYLGTTEGIIIQNTKLRKVYNSMCRICWITLDFRDQSLSCDGRDKLFLADPDLTEKLRKMVYCEDGSY